MVTSSSDNTEIRVTLTKYVCSICFAWFQILNICVITAHTVQHSKDQWLGTLHIMVVGRWCLSGKRYCTHNWENLCSSHCIFPLKHWSHLYQNNQSKLFLNIYEEMYICEIYPIPNHIWHISWSSYRHLRIFMPVRMAERWSEGHWQSTDKLSRMSSEYQWTNFQHFKCMSMGYPPMICGRPAFV